MYVALVYLNILEFNAAIYILLWIQIRILKCLEVVWPMYILYIGNERRIWPKLSTVYFKHQPHPFINIKINVYLYVFLYLGNGI